MKKQHKTVFIPHPSAHNKLAAGGTNPMNPFSLKGTESKNTSPALWTEIDYFFKIFSRHVDSGFQLNFGPFCKKKSVFEICENTTMSVPILCPAVCFINVMNEASMCGKLIKHITSQLCLLVTGKEQPNTGCALKYYQCHEQGQRVWQKYRVSSTSQLCLLVIAKEQTSIGCALRR